MLVSYLSVLSLCERSAVVRFSYMKNQDDLMHKVSGIHQAHNEVRIEQVGSNLPIINLNSQWLPYLTPQPLPVTSHLSPLTLTHQACCCPATTAMLLAAVTCPATDKLHISSDAVAADGSYFMAQVGCSTTSGTCSRWSRLLRGAGSLEISLTPLDVS